MGLSIILFVLLVNSSLAGVYDHCWLVLLYWRHYSCYFLLTSILWLIDVILTQVWSSSTAERVEGLAAVSYVKIKSIALL